MQHNYIYVDIQENCNQLLIIKKKLQKAQITPKSDIKHARIDATYLNRHASYLHVY